MLAIPMKLYLKSKYKYLIKEFHSMLSSSQKLCKFACIHYDLKFSPKKLPFYEQKSNVAKAFRIVKTFILNNQFKSVRTGCKICRKKRTKAI